MVGKMAYYKKIPLAKPLIDENSKKLLLLGKFALPSNLLINMYITNYFLNL